MSKQFDIPEITNPLAQPYVERQLLVVADDAVVKASREAALRELESKATVNWPRIAELAVQAALGMTGDLVTAMAKEAAAAWSRAQNAGVNVVQISKTEAAAIQFPPGHPRDGIVYIGHPATPKMYYPTGEFHRVAFEHKFAEAIRLLMHLGATEISVEHVRGWSHGLSVSSSLAVPSADVSAEAGAGSEMKRKGSLLFQATLDGTESPTLPSDLVWYQHEPAWQAVADGRIKFGLRNFTIGVSYNDDYGVNAKLKAAITKAGLEVGGKFEDHVSTEWRISGKFLSRKSPWGG